MIYKNRDGVRRRKFMKKDSRKRLTVFLLAVVMAFGGIFLPSRVEAASKPHMKTVNVKWDLKKNKTVTYKTRCAGLGMVKQKAKITDYKIRDSKKKGYKELTFTMKVTYQWNMSKNQVHKIANSPESLQGKRGIMFFWALVDYDSGKCLAKKNKKKVVAEYGDWVYSPLKYYYDDDGCWVSLPKNGSLKVKVTYPKDYKGLCIGIGGSTELVQTAKDKKFFEGKAVFGKTSYYSKKDKSVAHFMRVTK